MRGLIGGILTGGLVSAVGLGFASALTELPAGKTPPRVPLVDAPMVEPVADPASADGTTDTTGKSPVGSVTITVPITPALPEGEAATTEPNTPQTASPESQAPRADTDPLDEPEVMSIEGALEAPDTGDMDIAMAEPVDPVLPNPQALAPATPDVEADLTVSTTPALPTVVVEPEPDVIEETPETVEDATDPQVNPAEDTFVVDLGAEATPPPETDMAEVSDADDGAIEDAPMDQPADDILASSDPQNTSRVQLQGEENTLLGSRNTGVTVRRLTDDSATNEIAPPETSQVNALIDYAADTVDTGDKPLMSIVLIDDGSMSAAAAALSGLPFPVTIALDPSLSNVAGLMDSYRSDGFEVVVMAKLPEGAMPSDVEVSFQSVFSMLPEAIGVLDIGKGGLQADSAVTEQAMNILADQGRGFVTVSQGLNMASRAADAAGVPAAVVYRELDAEGQDARIVRRFAEQAAFRARQESGVVLVGRVRPDTISALILWGTANRDDQVAIVPLSVILTAED